MSADPQIEVPPALVPPGKPVKLVVWDLDHTLWDGVLLENDEPRLIPGVLPVIVGLDRLGILQSIASRNDAQAATAHLQRLGIHEYFLATRIDWSAKSQNVAAIAQALDIALDSVLFVDDQEFELEEVRFSNPQVRTVNAVHAARLLDEPAVRPAILTEDAPRRRLRYLEEEGRTRSEREFGGTPEEFMLSLNLQLAVTKASTADLDRVEELIARTNQLNSTGVTYSRGELLAFLDSPGHVLLVAELADRFGDYGKIAVVVLESSAELWTVKLVLVSCRVLSRGIGPVLLSYLSHRARAAGVGLRVEFRDTGRNRPMRVALMMAGFNRTEPGDDAVYLHADGPATPLPAHLNIRSAW